MSSYCACARCSVVPKDGATSRNSDATKLDWLRRYVPLTNGIPVDDTIARIISALSVSGFQECFLSWMEDVVKLSEGEIIALDGKTHRRSHDRKRGVKALHMVSAWACRNGVVLGQVKTDEKSNEIVAVPELLEKLELKGCIVTLDAMGCQRAIAKQVKEGGGDYVLTLKRISRNWSARCGGISRRPRRTIMSARRLDTRRPRKRVTVESNTAAISCPPTSVHCLASRSGVD